MKPGSQGKFVRCDRCQRYFHLKGIASHLRSCKTLVVLANTPAMVNAVVPVQDSRASSWLWYILLNPFAAIWTLFLFWLVAQMVEDGIQNYVAAPLAGKFTTAANHMITRYDKMQTEKVETKINLKRKDAERYFPKTFSMENLDRYKEWLSRPKKTEIRDEN